MSDDPTLFDDDSLVTQPSEFTVGRADELTHLARLCAEGVALVQVVGPVGIGKSQLLYELYRQHIEQIPNEDQPIFFCDATFATDERTLAMAAAHALGMRVRQDENATNLFRRFLDFTADLPPSIFILDHVDLENRWARDFLDRVLELRGEGTVVVATQSAGAFAETDLIELGPLALPPPESNDPRILLESPAVQLFLARAALADPAFNMRSHGAEVGALVHCLEGHPWAIEVAAAHLDARTLDQLLVQLATVPSQKDGTVLADPVRHLWHLLLPWEKQALGQLSLFPHGFFRRTAEDQIRFERGCNAPSREDTLNFLGRRFLLRRQGRDDDWDAERFMLPPTLHARAQQALAESPDQKGARQRYGDVLVNAAEGWAEQVDTKRGVIFRSRVLAEKQNLIKLLDEEMAKEDLSAEDLNRILRATRALDAVFSVHGPFGPYVDRLDNILEIADQDAVDPSLRAWVFEARGRALNRRGRWKDSLASLERAVELGKKGNDLLIQGRAEGNIGTVYLDLGRLNETREHYQRALELLEKSGARVIYGRAMGFYGNLLKLQGRHEEAREKYEEALAIHRETGDLRYVGSCLANLGELTMAEERLALALQLYEEALAYHQAVDNPRQEGMVLWQIGRILFQTGRFSDAEDRLKEALVVFEHVYDRRSQGLVLDEMASLAMEKQLLIDARRLLRKALSLHHGVGNRRAEGMALCRLGAVQACLDDLEGANNFFEEAQLLLAGIGDPFLLTAMSLYQGHLERALRRKAKSDGDRDAAALHKTNLQDRIQKATGAPDPAKVGPDHAPLASQSDEIRFALRFLIGMGIERQNTPDH